MILKNNFWVLFVCCLFALLPCSASVKKHLRKIKNKSDFFQIRNIDFIYLINLDERPERLENCLKQLEPYGIRPHRFSAINGWKLKPTTINDIGLKYGPGMETPYAFYFLHFPLGGEAPKRVLTGEESYGKTVFFAKIRKGALGCFLSHLSILQDAYSAGFDTIWVLEDDFLIKENPHLLATYIDKLDALVGQENWDILFTDPIFPPIEKMWRPDTKTAEVKSTVKYGKNFYKVGSRYGMHSMIVKRSGIKKILGFFLIHGIFGAYDHDLFLTPDIQIFMLDKEVITTSNLMSDTSRDFFTKEAL